MISVIYPMKRFLFIASATLLLLSACGGGGGSGNNSSPAASGDSFVVSTISGAISESGTQATFAVALSRQPSAEVKVPVSSSKPEEAVVSPEWLVFTPENWSVPQLVTVTAIDDDESDGDQTLTIVLSPATSDDPQFNNADPDDVTVLNTDDDLAAFNISAISGNTTESAGRATFTISLNLQPTEEVRIFLASSDLSEGTVSPDFLTFTSDNWDQPQTVTVTGADDDQADGDQAYAIILSQIFSSDTTYNGLDPDDVVVINQDDESTGVVVSSVANETSESGDSVVFTVRLASEPTDFVSLTLSSANPAEGTVSTDQLLFSTDNWEVPQSVTVTGVDDEIADGDQQFAIVFSPAVSGDTAYNGLVPDDIVITNQDDDSAGVIAGTVSGNTDEDGTTAYFTIRLRSQPTATVTIPIRSSDEGEGTVAPSSLDFTATDWQIQKTVAVTGVDDDLVDGDQIYTIILETAGSDDPNYQGLDPDDVLVLNEDNDQIIADPDQPPVTQPPVTPPPTASVGIQLGNISGNTDESGGTATFTMVLTSQPSADVTVGLSSSNPAEGSVSPSSLTFNSSNWNIAQTVTITGVDDTVLDGNQAFTILVAAASSGDPDYSGIDPPDVTVINVDDEVPDFSISPVSGYTDESGATATFSVRLTTQPSSDVVLPVSSSNLAEGTVSPATITFDAANWDVDQPVTITGVDDSLADGNQTYNIQLGPATSSDPNYNGLDPADVSIVNVDLVDPYNTTPQIAAGNYHNLVLASDGTVWGWGSNSVGQLDMAPASGNPVLLPRQLNISRAAAIDAGEDITAIVKSDGTLWTCGANDHDQLGHHPGGGDQSALGQVALSGSVVRAAAGNMYILALLSDGSVWGWGKNSAGQLGDGSTTDTVSSPVRAAGSLTGTTVLDIAAGQDHSIALDNLGNIHLWGLNSNGQLGDGNAPSNTLLPTQMPSSTLANINSISAGGMSSFAILTDESSWAWGYNSLYQLGTTSGDKTVPVGISGLGSGSGTTLISSAYYHTLALVNGTVYSWGDNDPKAAGQDVADNSGALGIGSTYSRTIPSISNLWGSSVVGIAAGTNHSLVLNIDGTMKTSGRNHGGQLGNGSIGHTQTDYTLSPVAVENSAGSASFHAYRPIVSGYPSSATTRDSADISVTCQADCTGYITHYQYEVNGGGFSGDIAINTPLALSGLSAGTQTVKIIAKYSNGDYQLQSNATTVSWSVVP